MIVMVLPLVDEHKPKCYLCHEGFENLDDLREHQNSKHKEFFESHEKDMNREPAPGDVTVF
jgi:quinol monooxygenase YgiN